MKILATALVLTVTFSLLGGCAHPRPCPPGYHLGPYGQRCILN